VKEIRYWGFLLIPIAWLRKQVLEGIRADKVVEMGFKPPARWVNAVLQWFMLLELFCLPRPPKGTSLMVLARKGTGASRNVPAPAQNECQPKASVHNDSAHHRGTEGSGI